jgi:hypothetical protein
VGKAEGKRRRTRMILGESQLWNWAAGGMVRQDLAVPHMVWQSIIHISPLLISTRCPGSSLDSGPATLCRLAWSIIFFVMK